MTETRFLYTVNPKKVIKSLGGIMLNPPVRRSKSLRLSKSEVLECLKFGSVYRRFANEKDNLVRVNIGNIDRLHRDTLISEEEYLRLINTKQDTEEENLVDSVPEEIPETKATDDVVLPEEESPELNDSIHEEIVEEVKSDEVAEEVPGYFEDKCVEPLEEGPNLVVTAEAIPTSNDGGNKNHNNGGKNYGGKNNKHRH